MSRVLLVEDDALNRMLVHELLELRGHDVVDASDVMEARLRLTERPFDIVLLDIHIPGGGGIAVLAYIRGTLALRSLPAVAVTAQAMSGDRERLLAMGFDGYISKPLDTKTFTSTVEKYIARPLDAVRESE